MKFFVIFCCFLCCFSLFSADVVSVSDIESNDGYFFGVMPEFVVSEKITPKISENSGAETSLITADDIDRIHPQSTADLVSADSSVSFTSYGALGALQNANIRGAGSSRTLVFLNSKPVVSAHDNNFDLSSVPVSLIDRVEIIKSGAGKNGKNSSVGGIINIVTKKPSENPQLSIDFENGSFIPHSAGVGALVDSQKLDVTYSFSNKDHGFLFNVGGIRAGNKYSFKTDDMADYDYRKNSSMWALHGNFTANGNFADVAYSSQNVVNYQYMRVPGAVTSPTPDDWQKNLTVSLSNSFDVKNKNLSFGYSYSPLEYCSVYSGFVSDIHRKHKLYVSFDSDNEISDSVFLNPFAIMDLDIDDSTSFDDVKTRFYPRVGVSANIGLDRFALLPMVQLGYASDMAKFVPSSSLRLEFASSKDVKLFLDGSYSKNLPSFSDLYWPDQGWYKGNPDLQPENATAVNLGVSFENDFVSADTVVFVKSINDMILYDWTCMSMPENFQKTFFYGFENEAKFRYKDLFARVGWLFNKAYDVSGNKTVWDDEVVANVRTNTLTFSLSYNLNKFVFTMDGKYLGKYYDSTKTIQNGTFLLNAGVDYKLSEKLKVYLKVDNVLNKQYQLAPGYPMTGTKIRIGGIFVSK